MSDLVKNLAKEIAKEAKEARESEVKMPKTEAPKTKTKKGYDLPPEALDEKSQRLLDAAYMKDSLRKAAGKGGLSDQDKFEYEKALQGTKTATLTTDISELIPSGFTGRLHEDIIAQMSVGDIIPFEQRSNGTTDAIETHGITAYLTDENATPSDTNDTYSDMIFLVKKAMAKTFISYEAIDDASIDMMMRKRASLTTGLARAWEYALVSGDDSSPHMDSGVTSPDYRTSWKGLRKLGLAKSSTDFQGSTLTDVQLYDYLLQMQAAGGDYLDENEVQAGNVALVVPQRLYQRIKQAEGFTDASKSGIGSTLTGGRPVADIWGIPVVVSKYMPALTKADGTVGDGSSGNVNEFASAIMFNKQFTVGYYDGNIMAETDRLIEHQRFLMTASGRYGFNSYFDRKESNPAAIDTTRNNIVAGININTSRS